MRFWDKCFMGTCKYLSVSEILSFYLAFQKLPRIKKPGSWYARTPSIPVSNRFIILSIMFDSPFISGKKIDAHFWTSYLLKPLELWRIKRPVFKVFQLCCLYKVAAEQKARSTYDNILRVVKDPDVIDPIRFLRAREVVHFQRFGEANREVCSK